MNNTLRYAIAAVCLMTGLMVSAVTPKKQALLLHPSREQVDSVISVLDNVIAHKKAFRKRKMERTDSLVSCALRKHGRKRVEALKEAYSYCSHVNGKKSMQILDRMAILPEYRTDRSLQLWVRDSRGYIYSVMGMYNRAFDLLNGVSVEGYDTKARMHHYEIMGSVLYWVSTAFCTDGALTADETAEMHAYSDSLLRSNRDAISMAFTDIDHDLFAKKYDSAIKRLVALYPKTSGQNETYVYAVMSDAFTGKKDTNGALFYLAKTSINDIEDGITEYMCLPILAQELFKTGDVDRAYNYLKCCIDDAQFYPSQYLINQATNLFPMIDKAYQQKKADYEDSRRNLMGLCFCAALLIFVIICLLMFLNNRQKLTRKLARANEAKDIFLKNMSHEVHTPLNIIYGFAQVLRDNPESVNEASMKEMSSAICEGAEQLTHIFDNVVEVTDRLSKLDKLEDAASIISK